MNKPGITLYDTSIFRIVVQKFITQAYGIKIQKYLKRSKIQFDDLIPVKLSRCVVTWEILFTKKFLVSHFHSTKEIALHIQISRKYIDD